MTDTIYTTQTPSNQEAVGVSHHLGELFSTAADGDVIGGRVWVPAGGRPVTYFWQLWRVSDTTLLAEVDLNTLPAPTPNTWMSFTSADFTTPGDVPIVTTKTYIVDVYVGAGDQIVYTPGFTYPIVNGVLTASEGRFITNQPRATMPTIASSNETYFADVNVETPAVRPTIVAPVTAVHRAGSW